MAHTDLGLIEDATTSSAGIQLVALAQRLECYMSFAVVEIGIKKSNGTTKGQEFSRSTLILVTSIWWPISTIKLGMNCV